MTLLFIEGFDNYDPTADGYMWTAGNLYRVGVNDGVGRFGEGGYGQFSTTTYWCQKNLDLGNKSTLYLGIAFYVNSVTAPTYSSGYPFITFFDENAVTQVRIHANANYGFDVYNGAGTSLGSTSNNVFTAVNWHYFEVKVVISDTVGEVTLRIDETQVANLTSKDTKNGTDYVDQFRLRSIYNLNTWVDDLYIDDAQFHGDCHVRYFMPDSVSSVNNDWTASAGNKDDCVDDVEITTTNDDTDYIYDETLNGKQTFGITTGPVGTIIGIQVTNLCRTTEAGNRKIKPLIRSNGANYQGTETELITGAWRYEHQCWETDPDDSNAWTQAKLEAAEFGLEITT